MIDQENLMEAFQDTGDPNVDMTHVGVFGRLLKVPRGFSLDS